MNDDLHSGWFTGPPSLLHAVAFSVQRTTACTLPIIAHRQHCSVDQNARNLLLRLPIQQLERLYASLHEDLLLVCTHYMSSYLHFGNEPVN
jgi:hypothetical protein